VAAVIFANDANSLVNDNPRDGIEQWGGWRRTTARPNCWQKLHYQDSKGQRRILHIFP
jgi:hypothetical protein